MAFVDIKLIVNKPKQMQEEELQHYYKVMIQMFVVVVNILSHRLYAKWPLIAVSGSRTR